MNRRDRKQALKLGRMDLVGVLVAAFIGAMAGIGAAWVGGTFDKSISTTQLAAAEDALSTQIDAQADQSRTEFFRQDRRQIYAEYLGHESDLRKLERRAHGSAERANSPSSRKDAFQARDTAARKLDQLERTKDVIDLAAPESLRDSALKMYNQHNQVIKAITAIARLGRPLGPNYDAAYDLHRGGAEMARKQFKQEGRSDLGTESGITGNWPFVGLTN